MIFLTRKNGSNLHNSYYLAMVNEVCYSHEAKEIIKFTQAWSSYEYFFKDENCKCIPKRCLHLCALTYLHICALTFIQLYELKCLFLCELVFTSL